MKRIALDMDEVIADVIPKFLDIYEAEFGYRLKAEDYIHFFNAQEYTGNRLDRSKDVQGLMSKLV